MRFPPAPPGMIRCPRCGLLAAGEAWTMTETTACQGCASLLEVRSFPALTAPPARRRGEEAVSGDSECFFHPGKRAERVCDRCGRFLCAVCDLPVGGRHLCPSCLESGLLSGEQVPELVHRRVNWGRLALSLALLPPLVGIVFYPLIALSALAALGCAMYGWKRPGSAVTGRARASATVAILLALAQLTGVVMLSMAVWKTLRRHG